MAEDSKINGFAWFLAGLGVGALAGILYAPKSGRETRDELANSAREGTEYLRNRSRDAGRQAYKSGSSPSTSNMTSGTPNVTAGTPSTSTTGAS